MYMYIYIYIHTYMCVSSWSLRDPSERYVRVLVFVAFPRPASTARQSDDTYLGFRVLGFRV